MPVRDEPPLRFFGTDGVRDVAGRGRLAPEALSRLGRALARFAREASGEGHPTILMGADPRPSSPELVARLAGAMLAEGARVLEAGVLPSPGLAWATVEGGYDLGCMVSASHNPPEFNGVKPFLPTGRKLDPGQERRIETLMDRAAGDAAPPVAPPQDVRALDRYVEATARWLEGGGRLDGLRVVVDLAAGSGGLTAASVLERLGARARILHPTGSRAINDACGTEHPEAWLAAVRGDAHDAGVAFDGDADRVLLATPDGEIVDGDDVLAILVEDAVARKVMEGDAVVSTVMANLGLEERLADFGVRLERAPVGDRNVAERMQALGAPFGGEPSGHIVMLRDDVGPGFLVGDGLVAAVRALQAVRRLGGDLGALRAARPRHPQRLVGVRVGERRPLAEWSALKDAIAAEERRLGGEGRVLVRYSGTEPLLRIMAEGRDPEAVEQAVRRIEAAARNG